MSSRCESFFNVVGTHRPVPHYARVLTFIPYLIVPAFLVLLAIKLGWGFLVFLAIWLAGSLLVAAWLIRRQRRKSPDVG